LFRSTKPAAISSDAFRLPRGPQTLKNPSSNFSSAKGNESVCKPYANLLALAVPHSPGPRGSRILTKSCTKHRGFDRHEYTHWHGGQALNVSDS